MTSFGKFTLRFAAYGVILLYLAGDLFLFHGPLYRRIEAARLESEESKTDARTRGIAAIVYGREITLAQLDHAVQSRLSQSGDLTIESLPPDQLRLHRYAALGDLIDHELLRVKVMHSSAEFPVTAPEIDAAQQRIAQRFPSEQAFLTALEKSGISPVAHRDRLAARLQQVKFAESRLAPLASPATPIPRQQAAREFRDSLRTFEANRDRILIRHEVLR